MIYDAIQSWVILIEKLAFFNKPLQGVYCILKKYQRYTEFLFKCYEFDKGMKNLIVLFV